MKIKDICTGVTDGSHNPPQGISVSDYLMLSSKNVFDNQITLEDPRFLSEEDFEREHRRTNVSAGDVLITIVGTVGRAAVVGEDMPRFTLQRSVAVLHPKKEVCSSKYLMYALQSKRSYLESRAKGVAQKGIYLKEVSDIDLKVVPISEQQIIVETLDKVASIISMRTAEIQKLDELIKARFVELFGDLNVNPKGWELKPFDELTNLITDGEHSTPRRCKEGIYLLSARNVLNHELQLEDVDYIDDEEYERISKRIIPQSGDVLLSCSGTVGRCCCVPEGLKFQMVRSIALLRFKEELNPVFAEYMITSDLVQQQIDKAKTASSQANLFQGKIAKLRGFVPPRELQDEFLVFVKQVDKSKVVVQEALDKAQLLFDSLMQEYFG